MGALDPPAVSQVEFRNRIKQRAPIGRELAQPADRVRFAIQRKVVVSHHGYAPSQANPSPFYWPQLIKTDHIPDAHNEWYKIWSTDHAGVGGVFLESADDPMAPAAEWTQHGRMYVDTTTGQQTETGRVIYAPEFDPAAPWHLYYQQQLVSGGVGNQQTLLAKSADFVNWTRVGIVLDVQNVSAQVGDGHCGYFSPTLIGRRIIGPHLRGGGTFSFHAMSESYDGITFYTDPRLLEQRVDLFALTNQRAWTWVNCNFIEWRGQMFAFGFERRVDGVVDRRAAFAPVSSDLRHLLAPPQVLVEPTEEFEDANPISGGCYVDGDRIILMLGYNISSVRNIVAYELKEAV